MENVEIARVFEEMADLLEIQGANPFRVRAYRNGARIVEEHGEPFKKLVAEEADLTEVHGIGKDLAEYIEELVSTGRLRRLEELEEKVPKGLVEIMRLPAIGPKKAAQLWKELDIETLADLEKAAKDGKVAELKGFGKKTQEKIVAAVADYQEREVRFKLSEADQYVEPLLEHMEGAPGIRRLEVAGSYRRRKETVGDIDLLAVAKEGQPVMDHFTGWEDVQQVVGAGETRGTVILRSGLQVDLRIVPPKSFGAALVYFTGSKAHNIALRRRAQERKLRISEYGVFRLDKKKGKRSDDDEEEGTWIAGRKEKDVYEAVELPWIPPELREDRGEIEAAKKGKLPRLLKEGDIRGDLQMHSTWSDGKNSIEEMLEGCEERGYEYLAITDHSPSLAMIQGLDAKKLEKQWREIEEVRERHEKIRLLRSMEVDILRDGSLDMEDDLLEGLDLVVVSIHSHFELPAAQQTRRVLRALEHPLVSILAHPTGRRINRRRPMEMDLEEILACAADHRVAVELNAQPERLDLNDSQLIRAKELGAKIVISTDAHSVESLDFMRYGVDQARRAGLEKKDVLNTRKVGSLLKGLRRGA